MLSRLSVKNFRSIESAEVRIAPLTILFGPTSSGKSSLFYAVMTVRNFLANANQAPDAFFNLGFLNLGGFEACVFDHQTSKTISIAAEFANSESGSYGVGLRKADADILARVEKFKMSAKVPIPYGLNQTWPFEYEAGGTNFTVNWNGIAATVAPKAAATPSTQAAAIEVAGQLNAPVEALKRIDICPHRRGFFKPNYTAVPLTATPTSEDEVATLIINDQHAPARISIDTVEIFDRDFRTYTPPGTATTFLQTTEVKGARVPALVVNDGFGVNQVIYMLAKIHRPDVRTVLIEEPEVHLHPTVIRRFARVIARLVKEDEKQLVFTTHSAEFLLAILACVREGLIKSSDVLCHQVSRSGKKTTFTEEEVSDQGQIAGGLASFMEGELEDIKTFLGASTKTVA